METTDAVASLSALAQDSRLGVFRLLVQEGPDGLAAGEIADRMGLPPATLSFHLAQLGRAGLVQSRRDGRSIIYAAHYAAMTALLSFLTENCCRGACERSAARGGRRRSGGRGRRPSRTSSPRP